MHNIRRHLHFLSFLAGSPPRHLTSVWNAVRQAIERLDEGASVLLGHVRRTKGYVLSPNNAQFPGTFEAIRFFAENHLNLPPVI